MLSSLRRVIFLGAILTSAVWAQPPQIQEIRPAPNGTVTVRHESSTNEYYLLLEGSTLGSIHTPIDLQLGAPASGELSGPAGPRVSFYRVRSVPLTASLDSDGDGLPDVYELLHGTWLNALDPTDALKDADGDGLTNTEEYQRGSDPGAPALTYVQSSSPAPGEGSVAVTRETILRLSRPLAAEAVVGTDRLYAEGAGRKLLGRVELSADRSALTLFHLEPLPAGNRIRVTFTGTDLKDQEGRPVDADGDGVAGGVEVIEFTTLNHQATPGTAVIGRVFASDWVRLPDGTTTSRNTPLAGVFITVDGAEQTLSTFTDADGNFRLEPSPAGRFFVHVDGRTAEGSDWPDGEYFPVVGKAWEAVAGRTDNLAAGTGEIFLPRIRAGTLQTVSPSEPTRISFPASVVAENPALAGVVLTVPPNALLDDDGSRGGKVGMAPVAPDRLPEPLPEGLALPLVITIQTDGPQNFDQPVPVRFPNLPDPKTGVKAAPGTKSALWSFNHDTGRWEIQGAMTVSADGDFVDTDARVGVRQPGWHGTSPGSGGGGGGGDEEEEGPCSAEEQALADAIAGCLQDLGLSLLELPPAIGCVIGLVDASFSISEACNDPAGSCGWTVTVEGALAILGCIPGSEVAEAIGMFAKALQCAADLGSALGDLDACNIINGGNSSPARVGRQDLDPTELPDDPLKQQVLVLQQMVNSLVVILGDEAWAQVARADGRAATTLLGAIAAAANPSSEGGETITATELTAIRALPVPPSLPTAAVQRLVDRLNRLAQGTADPVELAGITDAVDQLYDSGRQLQARGWVHVLSGLENGAISRSLAEDGRLRTRGPKKEPLHYLLTDLRTGFERRGRLSEDGVFAGLILAPNRPHLVRYYESGKNLVGSAFFQSAVNGGSVDIPLAVLRRDQSSDTDADGLSDRAEEIVGTDPRQADTDGDGLKDGAELQFGSNPLDGFASFTGVIASADTPGQAVGITVERDRVLVADQTAGLSVFNVFDGFRPRWMGQLDTPGIAVDVAGEGNVAAVADSAQGLALVDLSDPSQPQLQRQVALPGSATSVDLRQGIAYVGLGEAGLAVIDASTGSILQRLQDVGDVDDVSVVDDRVFVLTSTELRIYRDFFGGLQILGRLIVPGSASPLESGRKLFVGRDEAYIGTFTGFRTVDVTPGREPQLLITGNGGQGAIHGLAHNGVSNLVATTSFAGPASLAVSLFQAPQPPTALQFLASFDTPGESRAVVLHQGLAYIADAAGGLQVINFLARDGRGLAPVVTLQPPTDVDPAAGIQVWSGNELTLAFTVSDDVQIHHVELLVNGVVVDTDSNWPYDLSFVPLMANGQAGTVDVQVRAMDTGGNLGVSDQQSWQVRINPLSPFLVTSSPEPGETLTELSQLSLRFDVPLDPARLVRSGFSLRNFGADGQLGGGDDQTIPVGAFTFNFGNRILRVSPDEVLPPGRYQLQLAAGAVTSATGSALAIPLNLEFELRVNSAVVNWVSDQDGDWSNPANWSTGRVPGAADLVVIDRPQSNPTILIDANVTIAGLRCREGLILDNRTLTLRGSRQSEILGETLINLATVMVSGPGAMLNASGVISASESSFVAEEGARLRLPGLTTFRADDLNNKSLRAVGLGSRLELTSLTLLEGPFGQRFLTIFPRLAIEALDGGVVDLSAVTPALNGRLKVLAKGAGSRILIPQVQSMTGPELIFSTVEVGVGGELFNTNFMTASFQEITLAEGGTFASRQLKTVTNVVLQLDGGQPDFSGLQTAETLSLRVRSNAVLELPGLTSYAGTGVAEWTAEGSGSRIELPQLTSGSGPRSLPGLPRWTLKGLDGGRVSLGRLTEFGGRVVLLADGMESQVRVPALARLNCESFSTCEARNGGTVTLAAAGVEAQGMEFLVQATGTFTWGPLTLGSGAVLSGTGTFGSAVMNGGEVHPGTSPGFLVINGDYIQKDSGKLVVDLSGTEAGVTYDQLEVNGAVQLAGGLTVVRGSGFTPSSGNTFRVIRATSLTGTFGTLTGLTLGGVTLQPGYTAEAMDLTAP